MMHHGRDEADWDQLAEAGLEFLIEQARLSRRPQRAEHQEGAPLKK